MKKKLLLPFLALLALPLLAQTKLAPPSPEVEKTIQSALEKAQKGDLQGAIALVKPLEKPGAHPAVLSLLGSLYLEAGRPKDALALLEPIAGTDAAGPLILHNTARAALALNQTAKAEKYLKMAVAKAPGSPAARDLGLLLGSQGRLQESYLQLRPGRSPIRTTPRRASPPPTTPWSSSACPRPRSCCKDCRTTTPASACCAGVSSSCSRSRARGWPCSSRCSRTARRS